MTFMSIPTEGAQENLPIKLTQPLSLGKSCENYEKKWCSRTAPKRISAPKRQGEGPFMKLDYGEDRAIVLISFSLGNRGQGFLVDADKVVCLSLALVLALPKSWIRGQRCSSCL